MNMQPEQVSVHESDEELRLVDYPKVSPHLVPWTQYFKWLVLIIAIMMICGFACSLLPPVHKTYKKRKTTLKTESSSNKNTDKYMVSMDQIFENMNNKIDQSLAENSELQNKNIMYSPTSIFMALSMLYEGTSGMLKSDFQSNMFYCSELKDHRKMVQDLFESLGVSKNKDMKNKGKFLQIKT